MTDKYETLIKALCDVLKDSLDTFQGERKRMENERAKGNAGNAFRHYGRMECAKKFHDRLKATMERVDSGE